MPHIALLGDSIFDNRAYTGGQPDVLSHLRTVLPASWQATLCAVDGATTGSMPDQLARVPDDATHVVVSIGGNDVLQHANLLFGDSPPTGRSGGHIAVLQEFSVRIERFERAYRALLGLVIALRRATTVCTVYNGALDADRASLARLGVTWFDDVILRSALALGADVIELRDVCTEPADYANPIEPSGQGGLKIARTIAQATGAAPRIGARVRLWGR